MALKSYKTESLYSLNMYTQVIELQSNELMQFLEIVKKQAEGGKVRISYYNEVKDKIQKQIESNNELLDGIEKEISSRMRKKFPSLMTFRQLNLMNNRFEKEIASEEKKVIDKATDGIKKDDTKPKSKVVDFKISKEKRHVKKRN